jgi:hypothetical protein
MRPSTCCWLHPAEFIIPIAIVPPAHPPDHVVHIAEPKVEVAQRQRPLQLLGIQLAPAHPTAPNSSRLPSEVAVWVRQEGVDRGKLGTGVGRLQNVRVADCRLQLQLLLRMVRNLLQLLLLLFCGQVSAWSAWSYRRQPPDGRLLHGDLKLLVSE